MVRRLRGAGAIRDSLTTLLPLRSLWSNCVKNRQKKTSSHILMYKLFHLSEHFNLAKDSKIAMFWPSLESTGCKVI